jgi:TonB family protein
MRLAFIVFTAFVLGTGIAAAQTTTPKLVKEVKPEYTPEARAAKIQGTVLLQTVILADGTVGDVRVTRSLDEKYGLDRQAIVAVKQWLFTPGMRDGQAVAVTVSIEVSFNLSSR